MEDEGASCSVNRDWSVLGRKLHRSRLSGKPMRSLNYDCNRLCEVHRSVIPSNDDGDFPISRNFCLRVILKHYRMRIVDYSA